MVEPERLASGAAVAAAGEEAGAGDGGARDGDAGDLFIRCDATGTPASVGIVLARQGRLSLPGEEPTWECAALWGSSEALEGRWCRASRGDRYLPWYWMPHYRTLTPRRAA